jgi:hypothetical protein
MLTVAYADLRGAGCHNFCFSRQTAMTTYHRYECKIYDFLIASGMSIICFMAYRNQRHKAFYGRNLQMFVKS